MKTRNYSQEAQELLGKCNFVIRSALLNDRSCSTIILKLVGLWLIEKKIRKAKLTQRRQFIQQFEQQKLMIESLLNPLLEHIKEKPELAAYARKVRGQPFGSHKKFAA